MTPPLAFDVIGSGARLTIAHGFTQTRFAWGPFGEQLARQYELVRVDLPGHGGSSDLGVDFTTASQLLGEAGGPGAYLGYSMGGRLALRLALDRPDLVERLVLVGASPGIEDPGERRDRIERDERLAGHLEAVGVAVFLDEWLAQPLFASLAPEAAQIDARRGNTREGLASSLRLVGTGHQEPLWDRLHELHMPVLLVSGADDERFTRLATRMAERIGPTASTVAIADAGHAVHLERPDATARAILDWAG